MTPTRSTSPPELHLTDADIGALKGDRGEILAAIFRSIVLWGRAMHATRLVDVEGWGHFAGSGPQAGIGIPLAMLKTLEAAGLRTKHPFTLDPHPAIDFDTLGLDQAERAALSEQNKGSDEYKTAMLTLGLVSVEGYTCTPYTYIGGNIPSRDSMLAWSESSAVVFANSVLAARTNRNAVIMDLFCNIAGRMPYFGLLTDDGRKATHVIDVETSSLPNPQLLGAVIGRMVIDGVPYIRGLDRWIGTSLVTKTKDYLKEFGASAAAIGAIGLYHVDGLTPEALISRNELIIHEAWAGSVSDNSILEERQFSRGSIDTSEDVPERCFIGCPHLSFDEILGWEAALTASLKSHGRNRLAIQTIIATSPHVLKEIKHTNWLADRLESIGIRLTPSCCEDIMSAPVANRRRTVTNSVKLQAFTSATMLPDADLVKLIVLGAEVVNGR